LSVILYEGLGLRTVNVPVTVLLYNGSLLCGFGVPIKALM